MQMFVGVKLPSDEPVQYVGCDVLQWSKSREPIYGFREATEREIVEAGNQIIDAAFREDAGLPSRYSDAPPAG